MTDKQGCEYRKICVGYSAKYRRSPIIAEGFRTTCDDTLKKDFVNGLCPMHDIYSGLFDMISKHLQATNESLEGTIKKLGERE